MTTASRLATLKQMQEACERIGSGAYKPDPFEHCRACLEEAVEARDEILTSLSQLIEAEEKGVSLDAIAKAAYKKWMMSTSDAFGFREAIKSGLSAAGVRFYED